MGIPQCKSLARGAARAVILAGVLSATGARAQLATNGLAAAMQERNAAAKPAAARSFDNDTARETAAAVSPTDSMSLPDASSAVSAEASDSTAEGQVAVPYERRPVASRYEKYIQPGWVGQPLDASAKIELGLRDLYQPGSIVAIFASAGYSQVRNGMPNYGTDARAFGQRLGATALRDSSGNLLVDAVFAPLLHEDPRYYIEGPQHNVVHRTLYAITRPLVTRKDDGRLGINGALLLGDATASALAGAYYPQANRNFRDIASTYGGSIGGAAVGFFVDEFVDDVLKAVHLEKR